MADGRCLTSWLGPDLDLAEAQGCLPDYRLTQAIPAGAQGSVFRGSAPDGTDVVVKIVSGSWAERGEREIQALRLIRHPSIVRLVDCGSVIFGGQSLPFIATEFVTGENLRNKVDMGTFDVSTAPLLIASLANGLDAIWAQRVVHRDIKPENVMVTPDGSGVLLDLGVARCLEMTTLTVGGGSPGTLGYMSPEQASGERNLTTKSDVYSLGVTAYEAIVGDHPFGRNQIAMLRATRAPIVPIQARCSRTVVDLLASMMEPIPAMRPLPNDITAALVGEVA